MYGFVADVAVALRVEAKGGRVLFDDGVSAVALLIGGGGRLCAEGLEIQVRGEVAL